MQSGQGEVQVAQLEGAVKQITQFAQGSRFKQVRAHTSSPAPRHACWQAVVPKNTSACSISGWLPVSIPKPNSAPASSISPKIHRTIAMLCSDSFASI